MMFCARILFLLVSVTTVAAQTPPDLDKLRADGYNALFNLDYDNARRTFEKLIALAPDNPAGPESMATSLWIQQLNESWQRKSTLYSDKDDTSKKPKVDQRSVDEFRKWTRR